MPLDWNFWWENASRLNTSITVPLGSAKTSMSLTDGSGSLRRSVEMPCPATLLFESIEIGRRRNLKADARALRLRAFAQHDRVVIDRRGEIDGVFLLRRKRQADDLGIVFGLLREIGRLVGGMRDLADANHAGTSLITHAWRGAARL